MNNISTKNFTRISKRAAEKLYNLGGAVYAIPCKLHPENRWMPPFEWVKTNNNPFEFNKLVNECTAYNCHYNECGYYLAFYIKKEA